jgi:hypothetical protein
MPALKGAKISPKQKTKQKKMQGKAINAVRVIKVPLEVPAGHQAVLASAMQPRESQ